jgi:hypothetical protein
MVLPLLPTSLVGSYAQPEWLIDRKKLASRFPPRVRAWELWRVGPEFLEQAQDDATLIAIRDQERVGLDIITDGEMRPRLAVTPLPKLALALISPAVWSWGRPQAALICLLPPAGSGRACLR